MSKRKIPRNRKVSGVFLLPGNIKIMKNNSILKYGYLMKSLLLNEEEPIYGKYGMLRKQFLKEHRSAKYQYLLLTGKLTEHLNQIDQEARKQVEIGGRKGLLFSVCKLCLNGMPVPLLRNCYSIFNGTKYR